MSKLYIYVYLSLKGDQTFLNVSEREGEREKGRKSCKKKRAVRERKGERCCKKREREREKLRAFRERDLSEKERGMSQRERERDEIYFKVKLPTHSISAPSL